MTGGAGAYRLADCGERALVVEFGESVDLETNARVLALDAALNALRLTGVIEMTPTYRSLLIHYDPLLLSRAALAAAVEQASSSGAARALSPALWIVPCCYDPTCAQDLLEAAAHLGLTPERAAAIHVGALYRIYMYGFAPGCAYLGGLPQALAISRRARPRAPTPENAVLIGGGLGLIMTVSMPTGWYVLARTPERLFAPERARPFLMEVGDFIRFEAVDAFAFELLDARARAGEILARRIEAPDWTAGQMSDPQRLPCA